MNNLCIGAAIGMVAGICVGGAIVAKNKKLAKKIDDSLTSAKQKLNNAKMDLQDKFKNCDCGDEKCTPNNLNGICENQNCSCD